MPSLNSKLPSAVQGLVGAGIVVAGIAGFATVAGASASSTTLQAAYLSPGGSGSSCTSAAPCGSLSAALAAAGDGATITVAGGNYGDQTVKALTRTQQPKTVTVQAAAGQTPVFGKTLISQPGITFNGLSFDDALRLNLGPATVTNVHMIDAPILVRGNNITVTNSLIEGGAAHDGINIAGSPDPVHDVLIQGNTVRDIGASSGREEHPDCIQVFDANHITIEQNNLYNCWNSALTFSPGAHKGINNVLVQANFLQGCIPQRQTCGNGGSAMDLRTTVTNVTIRNDTFGKGSVRLPYQPGITATHNIVGYLSVARPCTTSLTNSLIGGQPTFDCKNGAPGTTLTTHSGNTTGTATYTDPTNGNLHLARALTPSVAGFAASNTSGDDDSSLLAVDAPADIDGQPLLPTTLGADQVGVATLTNPSSSESNNAATTGSSPNQPTANRSATSATPSDQTSVGPAPTSSPSVTTSNTAPAVPVVHFITDAPDAEVGGTYQARTDEPNATFSSDSPQTCSAASNGQVQFITVGDCVIKANSEQDGEVLATQQIRVGQGNPVVSIVSVQPVSRSSNVKVTTTVDLAGTPAGTVQAVLDGQPFGSPAVVKSGTTVSTLVGLVNAVAVGDHELVMRFTPSSASWAQADSAPLALGSDS